MLKRIILFLTLSLCLPMALVDTILSASPPPEFIPQMSIHIQEAQQKSGAPVIPFRKGFGSLLYQEQATTGLRTKLRKKVIGFYPHWIPSSVVQWNNLTHL